MYVSISFFLSFFLSLLRFFFKPGDYNKGELFPAFFLSFLLPLTCVRIEREFGSFGPDVGNVGNDG